MSLWATLAAAEADTFLFGDGHGGARTLTSRTVVNGYTSLTNPVLAGETRLRVPAVLVTAGDLIMLWQVRADQPLVLAPDASVELPATAGPGRFELARVLRVEASDLVLTAPLISPFPVGTQVVFVPEFSSLTVTEQGAVVAAPWDGTVGGIAAFLVDGPLANDGGVTAAGTGFRGALSTLFAPLEGCDAGADLPAPYADFKGESFGGFDGGTGQAPSFTAGGAGICRHGGGGGGGHWGSGGRGGGSTTSEEGGGLGGLATRYDFETRLVPGGASGCGWNDFGTYTYQADGQRGGGVVWVRARSVFGHGVFDARGFSGFVAGNNQGTGTAGGGAGGAVVIRSQGVLQCDGVHASGGGAFVPGQGSIHGPGGGGGGGLAWLQGATVDCSASVAGATRPPAAFSGEPGGDGRLEIVRSGLQGLATPTLESPLEGATVSPLPDATGTAPLQSAVRLWVDERLVGSAGVDASGHFSVRPTNALMPGPRVMAVSAQLAGLESARTAPRQIYVTSLAMDGGLQFASTPRDFAVCGFPYSYSRAGRPALVPDVAATFSLEGTLPPGLSVDEATGAFQWTPTRDEAGLWRFTLVAQAGAVEVRQDVEVEVGCPAPRGAAVGCGCGGGGGLMAFAVVLLFKRRRTARSSLLSARPEGGLTAGP